LDADYDDGDLIAACAERGIEVLVAPPPIMSIH